MVCLILLRDALVRVSCIEHNCHKRTWWSLLCICYICNRWMCLCCGKWRRCCSGLTIFFEGRWDCDCPNRSWCGIQLWISSLSCVYLYSTVCVQFSCRLWTSFGALICLFIDRLPALEDLLVASKSKQAVNSVFLQWL